MSTCSCSGSDNQIKSSRFSESCWEFYKSEEFKSSKRQITKSHSHFVPNPAYIRPFLLLSALYYSIKSWLDISAEGSFHSEHRDYTGISWNNLICCSVMMSKKGTRCIPLVYKTDTHRNMFNTGLRCTYTFKKKKKKAYLCNKLLTVSEMFQDMPILLYLRSTDHWPSLSWERER